MTTPSTNIGPFTVYERIGRGGMGEVFRGVHRAQGVPVALKVVTAQRAQNDKYIRAFRHEVHSMARLDHPGVVMVFDVGEVPEAGEELGLLPGSPFVAMELATHGTIDRIRKGLHWRRLRSSLYAILDALAHAHARGVIHRDLKPGNVLITAGGSQNPILKLADFGLAHAMDLQLGEGELGKKIAGTPRYMAPEQIEGKWRDQGPWTDLYALGCLVYRLINGEPPYSGDIEEILAGHLFEEPPPLRAKFELPTEFEGWLHTMMAKRVSDRYQWAADAAYALTKMKLPSAVSGEFEMDGFGAGLEEITNEEWSQPGFEPTHTTGGSGVEETFRKVSGFSATLVDLPNLKHADYDPERSIATSPKLAAPLPDTWRRPTRGRSMQLIGAGLGLYGVRNIPLVDRNAERNAIWQAIHDVHADGKTRAVMLRGAAGTGKSRLAEWMSERCYETGAAYVLKAVHGRTQGPNDGLPRMIGQQLRTHGLDRDQAHERIKKLYFDSGPVDGPELFDCRVLSEMCVPASDEDDQIRFLNPTERFTVMRRFLTRLSKQRPLVIWLDDAQWSVESLEFANFLLQQSEDLPALLLITIREEAVADDSLESRLLDKLDAHERGQSLRIQVLETDDHVELVEELLSLEATLAAEVALRTDGNPLFAVQLVGDWVQRGALEVSDDGFVLREGESARIPKSIQQVWRERITRLVQTYDDPSMIRRVLEAAAVLGDEVDSVEWRQLCDALDFEIEATLIEHMIEGRLALQTQVGWAFSHGMLRETLLAELGSGAEAKRYHKLAAATLDKLYPRNRMDIQERISVHLLEAEQFSRALGPLLKAAEWRNQTCDFDLARRHLELHSTTLDCLAIPASDERWGKNWLIHISSLLRQGIVDDAEPLVLRGNELAETFAWECYPDFVMRRASLARKRGDTENAHTYYSKGVELFDTDEGKGRCLYGVAETYLYRGKVEQSLVEFRRAHSYLQPENEGYALVLIGLASALMRTEDWDEARPLLLESVERFQDIGNRNGAATALNSLGELERLKGDYAAAADAYLRAREILVAIGSRGAIIPTMNLGLVNIQREHWGEARSLLESGLRTLIATGERSHLGLVYVTLLPCVAADHDWTAWDGYFSHAVEILEESEWVDRDIAFHAQLGGEMAMKNGDPNRARAALELALAQWETLGVEDKVEEVSGILES